jgi:RND family efflux transporter MFP subunit
MAARVLKILAVLLVAALAGAIATLDLPRRVATVAPARGTAVQAVYATGAVEPVHWAKLAPAVSARLVEILARDGDRVRKGDVLARLEQREACARLSEFEARERFLRADRERFRELFRRNVVSRAALDKAESEHDMALAAVRAARQCISDRTLTAPLEGVVLRQDGEIGEMVGPQDIVYVIGDPQPLRITADVDEEDIPLIRVGQEALVQADAFPEETIRSEVAEITPAGDPTEKTYRVRLSLPADARLRVGMTVEANIVTRRREDALLVPASALRDGHVWIAAAGRARRRAVETGIQGRDRVEIRSGLAADAAVIVNPPADLAEGEPVHAGGLGAWFAALLAELRRS